MLYICHIYYILLQYKNNTPPPNKAGQHQKGLEITIWRERWGNSEVDSLNMLSFGRSTL